MQRISDKFVVIHEDYIAATGDIGCSIIMSLIENFSKKNGEDTWVKISAQSIEDLTIGIVAKRTVSKKVKLLVDKGLIEVRLDRDSWPEYRINEAVLTEKIRIALPLRQQRTPHTLTTHPPYASSVPPLRQQRTPPYADSVPIISIKEEKKKRREEQLPPLREENISQTETVGEREAIQLSLLTEKEKSTEQKEETELNPEVRTLLKSYDKIPKAKRDRFCKGSLNSLYKTYGDALERLTSEYGIESCLDALEKFKQDEFWGTRGFPLRGFASQIERFLENASDKPGGYRRVERREKIAARPESAQMPAAPVENPAPLFASSEKADRVRKIKRREDARCIITMTLPDLLPEFAKDTDDIDAADSAVIERWFQSAREKWKETHGGFEPPCSTRPLC